MRILLTALLALFTATTATAKGYVFSGDAEAKTKNVTQSVKQSTVKAAKKMPAAGNGSSPYYIKVSGGATDLETQYEPKSYNGSAKAKLDTEDTGFKVIGGRKINDTLAVELMYHDLGKGTISGDTGDSFEYKGIPHHFNRDNAVIESHTRVIAGGVAMKMPLIGKVNGVARLGVGYSREDKTSFINADYDKSIHSEDGDKSRFIGYGGFGAEYQLTKKVAITADYNLYDKASSTNLGLKYSFGK